MAEQNTTTNAVTVMKCAQHLVYARHCQKHLLCIGSYSGGSAGKENPPAMQEAMGSIPGLGESSGEGKGLLQYAGLENFAVLGVKVSTTRRLSLSVH